MNVRKIFDGCEEIKGFDPNAKTLLDKIMNIKTPMGFDDEFATDEELQTLEEELDRGHSYAPQILNVKRVISKLPAIRSFKVNFI